MSKNLSKILPFEDFLYIFQLMEYDSISFLRWFIENPFRRDLQKKHKLVLTLKARLILLLALTLLVLSILILAFLLKNLIYAVLFFILFSQIFPVFLVIAALLIKPLDLYRKNKIVKAAGLRIDEMENLKCVAITGSFGKTSTKDMLYTLLWKKYRVVKTPASFNTKLGVSQTILDYVKENTDVFIAEIGAYKIGEIAEIVKTFRPKIGIITALGPQHLERFGSLENIAKAKFEIIQTLDKDALGILNAKYPLLAKLALMAKCRLMFYGTKDADLDVSNIKISLDGTSFTMRTPKGSVDIKIPLIGEHHAYNFLAAASAALELGLSLDEIKERANHLLPTPHRMEIVRNGNNIIIDNSFNSNLESAKSSFALLSGIGSSLKIVVTPGIIELGKETEQANKEFVKMASKVAQEIIIVGEKNKHYLSQGLRDAGFPMSHVNFAKNTQTGIKQATQVAKENSVILIENDLPDQYI